MRTRPLGARIANMSQLELRQDPGDLTTEPHLVVRHPVTRAEATLHDAIRLRRLTRPNGYFIALSDQQTLILQAWLERFDT